MYVCYLSTNVLRVATPNSNRSKIRKGFSYFYLGSPGFQITLIDKALYLCKELGINTFFCISD